MPAKIRLQRKGKKGQPFYHIVIADGRAPRDGRFIEKIGYYNPLTKPAEIEINFESALNWIQKGAQPTDTVKAILSYKGVMYKNHLLKGVQKGAFTVEEAETKFQNWLYEKETRIKSKKSEHELSVKEADIAALDHEKKVNETKAQALAKKYAKAQKSADAEEIAEVTAEEGATEVTDAVSEPVADPTPEAEVVAEEPVAEVVEEAEVVAEEPVAEVVEEAEVVAEEPVVEEPVAAEKKEDESTPEEPKKEEPAA